MSRRSERVAQAIKRETSLLIENELRDPRVGFVTITKVTITEDLRNAVIYYSVLGDQKAKKLAHKGLTSALPFIKREIGKRLRLRFMPEIQLKIDETMYYVDRIENVLKKIKDEKDQFNGGS